MNLPGLDELKRIIEIAEDELINVKNRTGFFARRKEKRIKKSLENGYMLLNMATSDEHKITKATEEIVKALEDDYIYSWLIFIFGILLASALLFACYEAYSFINANWDLPFEIFTPVNPEPVESTEESEESLESTSSTESKEQSQSQSKESQSSSATVDTEDVNYLVTVNYNETNIVDLTDQLSVSDSVGLNNPAQSFTISNDSTSLGNINYTVKYSINIIPLNDGNTSVLDSKYIKYQIVHTLNDGTVTKSEISTFSDLSVNNDGSLSLYIGTQANDETDKFDVILWVSSDASNTEQAKSYTFMFKVTASVY